MQIKSLMEVPKFFSFLAFAVFPQPLFLQILIIYSKISKTGSSETEQTIIIINTAERL